MSSSQPIPRFAKWMISILFISIIVISSSLFYVTKLENSEESSKELIISPQEFRYSQSIVQA